MIDKKEVKNGITVYTVSPEYDENKLEKKMKIIILNDL